MVLEERQARSLSHGSSPMINILIKELMYLIVEDQKNLFTSDNQKGEDETMETNKIQELMNEVETYKQAIQDAKDALASAEQELDETLDAEFNQ